MSRRGDIGKWDIFRFFVKPYRINLKTIPIGLNDTFGTEVTVIDVRAEGYNQFMIFSFYDNVGGTFASGETLTVRRVYYYADGSTITFDRTYTSTGYRTYTESFTEVSTQGRAKPLIAIGVMAKTNMSTTNVILYSGVSGYMI